MSEAPFKGKVVRVSGRGYGKTQAMREMEAQLRYGHMAVSQGGDWDTPARTGTHYEAQMRYELSPEDRAKLEKMAVDVEAAGWGAHDPRYFARVLGQWDYTPREELLSRLNSWLRGTDPGEPTTWKGLK